MRDEGVVTRLVACIKALLPTDWLGRAGREFRAGTELFSEFVKENRLGPEEIVRDGVDFGRRAIEGVASEKHAGAQKNYAEAARTFTEIEDKKIEIELKRRSLETEIEQKRVNVEKTQEEKRKLKAEADLAEINCLKARIDLQKALEGIGVVLQRDERGNFTMLPAASTKLLPSTDEELEKGRSA